jgi:hypothetical protein
LSHGLSSCCSGYFGDKVLLFARTGLHAILLISASHIAGITGVSQGEKKGGIPARLSKHLIPGGSKIEM